MNEDIAYAVEITADKPVAVNRIMFSSCRNIEGAKTNALKQFDKYYPEAKDRDVRSVVPYSEYRRRIDEMAEMNEFMNS